MKKYIKKFICYTLCLFFLFGFASCGGSDTGTQSSDKTPNFSKTISTTINHSLYKYIDIDNYIVDTNKKSDTTIECKERYKLVFNVEFNEAHLKKYIRNKGLEVNVVVKLGDYENDENINYLNSREQEDGGGLDIKSDGAQGQGVYKAQFNLKKNKEDNTTVWENSYFIVGIDTLKNGANVSQPIEISFISDDETIGFLINNQTTYSLTLNPVKGNFNWGENNISEEIGMSAKKNNITIAIPEYCNNITLIFWKDSNKKQKYGEYSPNIDELETIICW